MLVSSTNLSLFKNLCAKAAQVAQQFSAALGPGPDPGDLGSSPTSGFLLLPLSVSLPLSRSL